MRKCVILAIGGLVLLAGCGPQGNKGAATPDTKWKGAPYRLTFETKPDSKADAKPDAKLEKKAAKPNPAAVVIPPIHYTANPEALENRAILVMRFAGPPAASADPDFHLMIGTAVDIRGAEGDLPASYLTEASKSLTDYLSNHCIQGDIKVQLLLARSSVKPQADDAEVTAKKLSDWLPFQTTVKNPHLKCK